MTYETRTKDENVLRVLDSECPRITVAELCGVEVTVADERRRRARVRLEVGLAERSRVSMTSLVRWPHCPQRILTVSV